MPAAWRVNKLELEFPTAQRRGFCGGKMSCKKQGMGVKYV
jgi:hypothetical protein